MENNVIFGALLKRCILCFHAVYAESLDRPANNSE